MKPRRIFLNAHDAGGGSAAPVATPPATTPAAPPAPTTTAPAAAAAPAPSAPATPATTPQAQGGVDVEAIAKAVHDKVFAALNRAGVLGGGKPPKPASTPATNGDGTPAAQPTTTNLRALDRALGRAGRANIEETAYARIERSFAEEQPADADAWVTSYFSGLGISAPAASVPAGTIITAAPAVTTAAATVTTTPSAAAQPATPPVTNRPPPPPPQVPLEEQDLASLSPADRDTLIKQKGFAWYRETLLKQMTGRQVRVG